jgi:toxin ParE1/3/4
MRVNFTRKSLNELEAIFDYIAQDNPVRAASFILELRMKAVKIGDNPHIFTAISKDFSLRKRSYKGYLIIYRVKNDAVDILHIINAVRDYSSLIK